MSASYGSKTKYKVNWRSSVLMSCGRLDPHFPPLHIKIDFGLCSQIAYVKQSYSVPPIWCLLQPYDKPKTSKKKKRALSKNFLSWSGPDLKGSAEGSIRIHLGLSTSNMNQKKKMVVSIYIEWINKVLLCSTGNYIQYPVINHNGKEYEKECIYMYNWVTLLYSSN